MICIFNSINNKSSVGSNRKRLNAQNLLCAMRVTCTVYSENLWRSIRKVCDSLDGSLDIILASDQCGTWSQGR